MARLVWSTLNLKTMRLLPTKQTARKPFTRVLGLTIAGTKKALINLPILPMAVSRIQAKLCPLSEKSCNR